MIHRIKCSFLYFEFEFNFKAFTNKELQSEFSQGSPYLKMERIKSGSVPLSNININKEQPIPYFRIYCMDRNSY